jgi:hypothetical protein
MSVVCSYCVCDGIVVAYVPGEWTEGARTGTRPALIALIAFRRVGQGIRPVPFHVQLQHSEAKD